jgi:hypothetical protein
MRRVRHLVFVFTSFSLLLHAGQIYGTIRESGRGVGGAAIRITINGKDYPASTAPDGGYRVVIPEPGRGEIQVTPRGRATARAPIFSYANPVKFDFELSGNQLIQR